MIKLDKINKKILKIVQNDGSITNSELSKKVGLAPASTLERVRKLEQSGIIRKYVGLVDPVKIGKEITAFVEITLLQHNSELIHTFINEVTVMPEVLECHHIAGDKDFLLKIVTADLKQYKEFALEKLAELKGVGKIQTLFSLNTVKDTTAIPID